MINLKTKITTDFNKVLATTKKKVANPLSRCGFQLMRFAQNLISKPYNKKPSKAGEPPKTRTGRLIKNIKYKLENMLVKVGILREGFYGVILEKGGMKTYKNKNKKKFKRYLPPRPFMKPTLESNLPKITRTFGSFLNK